MTNKQKQLLLAFLGLYGGNIDGIWGSLSQSALEAFQRDHGLPVGKFTEETQAALQEAVAAWEPEESQTPENGDFWDEIEYFTRDEPFIACPCGRCGGFPVEPDEQLMRNADATRRHFGKPMIPTSTVRCDAHNASLKGSAPNSWHKKGKAMDFGIPGEKAATIVAFVWTLPRVCEAYAIDDDHVHMAVR